MNQSRLRANSTYLSGIMQKQKVKLVEGLIPWMKELD